MTREQALLHSPEELDRDRKYFLKKMGWTKSQLEAYLHRAAKPHDAYPRERFAWDFICKLYQMKRSS